MPQAVSLLALKERVPDGLQAGVDEFEDEL